MGPSASGAIVLASYVLIIIVFNPRTLLSLYPWARYKYFVHGTLAFVQSSQSRDSGRWILLAVRMN